MIERTQQESIIGKLWHSDIHDIIPTELTQELYAENRSVNDLEKRILETLSPEQKELFDKYLNELTIMFAVASEQAFRKGFKLAMRIMAQGIL
jgi:hypothetical protein